MNMNRLIRPSSTIGITTNTNTSNSGGGNGMTTGLCSPLNNNNSNNSYYCNGGFIGVSGHTSVAKKYFSKPKTRNNSASQTTPT